MKPSVRRLGLITAATIGVSLGLIAPKPANAVWVTFHFELWPGGGSTLSCGWHSGTCYDDDSLVQSGASLDWSVQTTVRFVGKESTGSQMFAVGATGWAAKGTQSDCTHQVHVSVYDILSNLKAGAEYLHTESTISDHSFNISSGYQTLATTTESLG